MDVVERWVGGWAAARGLAWTASPLVRVAVGDAKRDVEYVGGPGHDLDGLVTAVAGDERTWLTLLGSSVGGLPVLADEERLMATQLAALDRAASGLRSVLTASADRVQVRLYDGSVLAASGQIGIAWTTVVADRISTEEPYRGRGLAGEVMTLLTSAALDRGARDGLLIASALGVGLYERLGWEVVAPVVTYAGA